MPRRRKLASPAQPTPDTIQQRVLDLLTECGTAPRLDGESMLVFLPRGTPANMLGKDVIAIGRVRVVDGVVKLAGVRSTPVCMKIATALQAASIRYQTGPDFKHCPWARD